MSLIASQTISGPRTESPPPARLLSLDAYRGAAMLLMVSGGLGLAEAATHFPGNRVLQAIADQTTHVRWQGCHLWDLIMPAFIFIVGAAIPFSLAARQAKGQSPLKIAAHVLWRSLILVLLGILLFSNSSPRTEFMFINVLCQIGLAYPFAVLLAGRRFPTQLVFCLAMLVAYWLWFCLYPLPGGTFDYASVGVPANWNHPAGLAAHWDLNTNPAAAFDRWFLNLFPRQKPFLFRGGGGTTLNFVPTIATMVIGVMVGEGLARPVPANFKLRKLLVAGTLLLAVGVLIDPAILPGVGSTAWTLCPIVKCIWTPSYVLYSGGWVILAMALMYWVVEVRGRRAWTFPLVVVGMNPLGMYLMTWLCAGWVARTLQIHLGPDLFQGAFGPVLKSAAVMLILWLACLWLYRRRVFIRL